MYLVGIHVPARIDGAQRAFLPPDWLRSLELLRDSFGGRFGPVVVACPSLPLDSDPTGGGAVLVPVASDDIRVLPCIDARCRTRDYWSRDRRAWLAHLSPLIEQARVVHAGLDTLFRPLSYHAFAAAHRAGRPTVFVRDIDIALQLGPASTPARRASNALHLWRYQSMMNAAVRKASLSLLKGSSLMERFGPRARNAHEFQDTMHAREDVISADLLERRLAERRAAGGLRLVYAGRLVQRKGVAGSIRAVAAAPACRLTIIGDGEQRRELEALAAALGAADRVRFIGALPYGPGLHEELRRHDALLFTPEYEDTPRMIFDAFAAGLPLLGAAIPYILERARLDGATVVLQGQDPLLWGRRLVELGSDQATLDALSRRARAAGEHHAAESWYERRAAWTVEAVDRFRHGTRAGRS